MSTPGPVLNVYHAPSGPPPGATDPNSPNYDATYDPNSPLYIDRTGTSDTSEEVQEQAEQQVDQDIDQSDWWEVWKHFTRNSEVNDQYNQEMSAQASQLAAGVDTRPQPSLACTNYMSIEHTSLQPMVTQDVDPDQVGEMGQMYVEAGNQMTSFQNDVASAINSSQTDWQGTAGDSARRFMADIGNWVGKAGQSAQLAGTQTGIQATALAEAKNAMPEPVPFDLQAANRDLATTTNPIELATKASQYMNDYRASQAAHEQAARVVGTYDGALGSSATMPAFATPPDMSGQGTDDPGAIDDGSSAKSPGDGGVAVPGGGPQGGFTPYEQNPGGGGTTTAPQINGGGGIQQGGGNGSTGNNGATPTPQIPTTPGGNTGNGTTTPGQYTPSPNSPGYGPNLPGGGTGTGGGPNGATGGNLGGMAPFAGGPMGGLGQDSLRSGRGAGGFGGTGGFGGGGSGAGGSGGGAGGSGGGAGGSGAGGAGAGGLGAGAKGAGVGAGAMAAEQAIAGNRGAGAAGAAGGRGAGGAMGGMGGGARGQGGEDDEHQRPSYLVEADPDEVFGTDEITAPPVIGG